MNEGESIGNCKCGKPAYNKRGEPRCDDCRNERKRESKRRIRAQERQSRLPRLCECGASSVNSMGVPRCKGCRATLKEAREQRAKEFLHQRRGPRACGRCGASFPYDRESPRARLCGSCSQVPNPKKKRPADMPRMCYKCGEREARNQYARPVCDECAAVGVVKYRDCTDCGARFKTTNNSTRCSACGYRRAKHRADKRCSRCDTLIDPRSRRCPQCPYRQPSNAAPIGHRRKASHGYIEVKTVKGWLREHVHVMEEHMGRRLLPGESVHHKNGVRDDNRVENLELWARHQPSGQRAADLLAWAREVIERYENAPL